MTLAGVHGFMTVDAGVQVPSARLPCVGPYVRACKVSLGSRIARPIAPVSDTGIPHVGSNPTSPSKHHEWNVGLKDTGVSFNGKTQPFEGCFVGSNPTAPTNRAM